MARWLIAALLMVFTTPTFAASYVVTVHAMAAPGAKEKRSFFLVPDEKLDVRSLEHQQYERQLKQTLATAGFVEAADPQKADIAVYVTYGIGPPQKEVVSYALPVWGQTGVSSSHTTGTITSFGNTSNVSATTTHTPTYGVTGYRTVVDSTTLYERHLTLVAFDYQQYLASGEMMPVWDAKMVSTGSSGVLSQIFPVMLSKSYEYFGTNMGQPKAFRVSDRNRAVRNLRDSD